MAFKTVKKVSFTAVSMIKQLLLLNRIDQKHVRFVVIDLMLFLVSSNINVMICVNK